MNIDRSAIFSHCVYDVDNRYVDLTCRRNHNMGNTFTLTMSDTSNNAEFDMLIDLFLTEDDLKNIIDRLTWVRYVSTGVEE
jgi:hypothetical protein